VRACQATKRHGVAAVVRATRVQRSRSFRARPSPENQEAEATSEPCGEAKLAPVWSWLELSTPLLPSPRLLAAEQLGFCRQQCSCIG
jgi:hypothetical protein